MAESARHANLNLTPEEKRVYYQLFQAADTTNLGVITGEIAVPFFEKTKLAPETLGLIWQIADKENRGLLTPSGFGIVMRLIGHAQAGRPPTDELAMQPGPLPRFDGMPIDTSLASREMGTTSPSPAANTGAVAGTPIRVPPLNPEDVNKFLGLFEKSDMARSGVLSGETAKQIFERARLPNDILGRIWNLADTKQRGALDATEFIIAMHLLTSYRLGAMRGIPQALPPGLYDAASRRGSTRSSVGSRPGLDVPPVPAIPKQFTGPQRTQSPINRQFGSPLSIQTTGGDWLVSPPEKSNFDNIFATVDTAQAGAISGDQAVAFFMNAQLPEETLAQIWDLADIDADGQLTRDEFAVAMYLIRLQRGGKELPQTLPPGLIPPSMRRPGSGQVAAASAPLPQAPIPAPVQAPRSAAEDLFGLDSFSAPSQAAAPQVPQSTGGSNPAFQTPGSPSTRASPPSASTNTFKPFIPTSTFGQSIQPQVTGTSAGTPQPVRSPPPPADDLLGDNDPEESNKLTNETTELANLSNQIGSLANEMQNVQNKRTSAEQNQSQTSQQKRDFEARLAQARSMYEQEVKNFKALEERLNASKAETSKLQQEYALLEGSRQDLQNQYDQASAALTADQQENASLKEKIREANAAVAQLKPALEKARSGARQQKGLVAINKKQLATVEGEQGKLQEEISYLSKEQPRESDGNTTALEEPAAVISPAPSTASQNTNPFFKRTTTGSSDGQALSPQISNDQQRAFDSLFGPSFASPSTAGAPPPPTSFRADSQPTSTKSPATSEVPTPSVSPPPPFAGAVGVPSPSESRQLTPNALPLTDTRSETSSTMVSPPGSRFGGQTTPSEAALTSAPHADTEETKQKSPEIPEVSKSAGSISSPVVSPGSEDKQTSKDLSFDELFGGPAHKRSQSQKENDFEEAFASLKQPSGDKANGTTAAPESEFPPIRELDDDDDGESTDSEPHMGFDDNFTPVVPPQSQVASAKVDNIEPSQLAAFPSPGTATSPTTQEPPAADTQTSPPGYEQSVKQGTADVPEFNGLLPQRGDPTAFPDAPHSVDSSTGAPIVHGEPQEPTSTEAPGVSEKKSSGPDFEAAFAGLNLAPAKESEDDDDDDDDFETPDSKSNNGNNADFDFSFDNPPSAQQKTHPAGTESSDFFSFNKNASAMSPGDAPGQSPSDPNAKAPSNDWEALFAPLDNVNPAKSADTSSTNGASPASDSKAPGWALQTGTEDDQFLQRLTGMGFPREESLKALEQFDYNLDKAVDHLTTKS